MDCDGKRSATPLCTLKRVKFSKRFIRPKAPSPLRSASAAQDTLSFLCCRPIFALIYTCK